MLLAEETAGMVESVSPEPVTTPTKRSRLLNGGDCERTGHRLHVGAAAFCSLFALYLYGFHRPGTEWFGVFRDLGLHNGAMKATASFSGWWAVLLGSLPMALGLVGGCLSLQVIWQGEVTGDRYCLLLMAIFLGSEIAQAFRLIPGVYDPVDLAFLIGAIGIISCLTPLLIRKEKQ